VIIIEDQQVSTDSARAQQYTRTRLELYSINYMHCLYLFACYLYIYMACKHIDKQIDSAIHWMMSFTSYLLMVSAIHRWCSQFIEVCVIPPSNHVFTDHCDVCHHSHQQLNFNLSKFSAVSLNIRSGAQPWIWPCWVAMKKLYRLW